MIGMWYGPACLKIYKCDMQFSLGVTLCSFKSHHSHKSVVTLLYKKVGNLFIGYCSFIGYLSPTLSSMGCLMEYLSCLVLLLVTASF